MAAELLAPHALLLDAARQVQVIRQVRGVVNHVSGDRWVMGAVSRIMDREVPADPVSDRSTAKNLQAVVLLLEIADMHAARGADTS